MGKRNLKHISYRDGSYMGRKPTAQEIYEKQKKRRLKKDYEFKQALLSANPDTIKAALKRSRIPYPSDDSVLLQTAKSLTSYIKDCPAALVYVAIMKYDEQLKSIQDIKDKQKDEE